MNSKRNLVLGVSIVLLIVFCGVAWGQDIKTRMRDRLPTIRKLKDRRSYWREQPGLPHHIKATHRQGKSCH